MHLLTPFDDCVQLVNLSLLLQCLVHHSQHVHYSLLCLPGTLACFDEPDQGSHTLLDRITHRWPHRGSEPVFPRLSWQSQDNELDHGIALPFRSCEDHGSVSQYRTRRAVPYASVVHDAEDVIHRYEEHLILVHL